jgi:gluconolactonase
VDPSCRGPNHECAGAMDRKPVIGSIERLQPAFDALVPPGAVLEVIAEGFGWAEGPLWLQQEDRG